MMLALVSLSCSKAPIENTSEAKNVKSYKYLDLNEDFKSYWFDGTAEISSYHLTQMRYGEPRKGSAVLIFVKESFLKDKQVKADVSSKSTVDVLKLNYTKNFNTGIYPYSIMQSVFSPLTKQPHALKVTASTQEWCGQTYMQLNNRGNYNIRSHSYFQGEDDQELNLEKEWLENELWTKLRINPTEIPLGNTLVLPDFSYLRLKHKAIKNYKATISQTVENDTLVTQLAYSKIDRTLKIYQENKSPYQILKWQEIEGNGSAITEAILHKTIKTDYWNKNSNRFEVLRDSLGL